MRCCQHLDEIPLGKIAIDHSVWWDDDFTELAHAILRYDPAALEEDLEALDRQSEAHVYDMRLCRSVASDVPPNVTKMLAAGTQPSQSCLSSL